MGVRRVVGILLIVIGLVALAIGGISYTRERKVLDLGPIEAHAEERKTIPLPPVLGIVSVVAGVALLVIGRPART